MGKITLTEEMISTLKGLSIQEQAKFFGVVSSETTEEYSYGQSEGGTESVRTEAAESCYYTRKWIVKDGIIVGAVFSNYAGRDTCRLLGEWCNTYFCMDDDGTGSEDVTVYSQLVWLGKK